MVYLRLHGSPRMYYSAYDSALIDQLSLRIQSALDEGHTVCCAFDNTASGGAVENALSLAAALSQPHRLAASIGPASAT